MNREEIIRLAREAGLTDESFERDWYVFQLERFAALVAAAERNRIWTQEHWTDYERSIAAAEREACAKVCESYIAEGIGREMAEAIRARGQA